MRALTRRYIYTISTSFLVVHFTAVLMVFVSHYLCLCRGFCHAYSQSARSLSKARKLWEARCRLDYILTRNGGKPLTHDATVRRPPQEQYESDNNLAVAHVGISGRFD